MLEPAVACARETTSALIPAVSGAQARLRICMAFTALVLFLGVELPAQTAPVTGDGSGSETNELRELREAVRQLQVQVAELKRELHDQRATDARPVNLVADTAPAAGAVSAATKEATAGQDTAAAAKSSLMAKARIKRQDHSCT